jgi:hypothetical protein
MVKNGVNNMICKVSKARQFSFFFLAGIKVIYDQPGYNRLDLEYFLLQGLLNGHRDSPQSKFQISNYRSQKLTRQSL